jgi:hypothetical protein
MRRWFFAILAWLMAVAVLGPVMFVVAIVLAGPHSSMLPSAIQPAVLVIGWVVFLAGPVFIARSVWRRTTVPRGLLNA